jgi:hypothetical protein
MASNSNENEDKTCALLSLPTELRIQIYNHHLTTLLSLSTSELDEIGHNSSFAQSCALLCTCRLILLEACPVYFSRFGTHTSQLHNRILNLTKCHLLWWGANNADYDVADPDNTLVKDFSEYPDLAMVFGKKGKYEQWYWGMTHVKDELRYRGNVFSHLKQHVSKLDEVVAGQEKL